MSRRTTKLEGRIQSEILVALGQMPDVMVNRINSGLFRAVDSEQRVRAAPPGHPDLEVLCCGITLHMEVKTKSGRLNDNQERWRAAAKRAGVPVHVIRSADEALALVERVRAWAQRSGWTRRDF